MTQKQLRPAGRASWSGLLQVSLVAVPVKAYPATSAVDEIRFNQLHADCGQRIRYEKHCPLHGKVEQADIVRGYPYAADQYVVIDEAELDRLRPAKDKAVVIEHFVEAGAIDPQLYCGRSLYLLPDGPPAARSYRVLQQAMQQRGTAAVGRVTISGRRLLVLLRPAAQQLVMHVLHYPAQIRAAPQGSSHEQRPVSDDELQLACQLIDAGTRPLDWSQYRNDTADKLAELIEAKLDRQAEVVPPEEPAPVVQLFEALRQSVAKAQHGNQSSGKKSGKSKTKRRTA